MYYSVLFVLSGMVALGSTAGLKELLSNKPEWSEACVKETGFQTDDPLAVWKSLDSVTRDAGCYLGCMLEKVNIIVNGKLHAANGKALASNCYQGETLKTIEEIVDKCEQEVTTTDRCETGPLLLQCLKKYKDAKGMAL